MSAVEASGDGLDDFILIRQSDGPRMQYAPPRGRAALELLWTLIPPTVLVLVDLIFHAYASEGEKPFVGYPVIAFAVFSVSAAGLARAIHNRIGLESTVLYIPAMMFQIVIAVLNTENLNPPEFFWWALLVSSVLTLLAILLGWWPGGDTSRKRTRR